MSVSANAGYALGTTVLASLIAAFTLSQIRMLWLEDLLAHADGDDAAEDARTATPHPPGTNAARHWQSGQLVPVPAADAVRGRHGGDGGRNRGWRGPVAAATDEAQPAYAFAQSHNSMEDALGVVVAAALSLEWGAPAVAQAQKWVGFTGTMLEQGQRVGSGQWWTIAYLVPEVFAIVLILTFWIRRYLRRRVGARERRERRLQWMAKIYADGAAG